MKSAIAYALREGWRQARPLVVRYLWTAVAILALGLFVAAIVAWGFWTALLIVAGIGFAVSFLNFGGEFF